MQSHAQWFGKNDNYVLGALEKKRLGKVTFQFKGPYGTVKVKSNAQCVWKSNACNVPMFWKVTPNVLESNAKVTPYFAVGAAAP